MNYLKPLKFLEEILAILRGGVGIGVRAFTRAPATAIRVIPTFRSLLLLLTILLARPRSMRRRGAFPT